MYMAKHKSKRIMLAVMPYEGEVLDRVTDKFYKNKAVKYMPLGVLTANRYLDDSTRALQRPGRLGGRNPKGNARVGAQVPRSLRRALRFYI